LIKEMESLGIILDVTHLTDLGFQQVMERFEGPIIASHHNCRTLVDHQRQLTDKQINTLVQRESVIGVALDAWMLVPDWERGTTTPEATGVSLEHVADNIDHVCQLAGSAFIARSKWQSNI
jgi:membrane dipeptidase